MIQMYFGKACKEYREEMNISQEKFALSIGMDMRLTPREKEMADMFEQMSKEEQEIMIELVKRMRTEEPEKLLKEIKQRLNIDDGV